MHPVRTQFQKLMMNHLKNSASKICAKEKRKMQQVKKIWSVCGASETTQLLMLRFAGKLFKTALDSDWSIIKPGQFSTNQNPKQSPTVQQQNAAYISTQIHLQEIRIRPQTKASDNLIIQPSKI
jgi:hypothetical protein